MMKYIFPLFFFLVLTALEADTAKRFATQTEVYLWGSIFLALSLGSLLLLVNLFPKGEAYKAYEQKMMHLRKKSSVPKYPEKENVLHSNTEASSNLKTEIEKTEIQTKPATAVEML